MKILKFLRAPIYAFSFFFFFANLSSCDKTEVSPTSVGTFTCKINGVAFSSTATLLNGSGGTLAVFTDTKKNYFQMAFFEKDFPINKAVGVAYSPTIAYSDDKKVSYIAKSGTVTITSYSKNAQTVVTGFKGTFDFIGTSNGVDLKFTEGKFNVGK